MTQELINKYFQSELGQQCDVLFSTADDRVFIRHEEAKQHSIDHNLDQSKIEIWFEDYGDEDSQESIVNDPTNPNEELPF